MDENDGHSPDKDDPIAEEVDIDQEHQYKRHFMDDGLPSFSNISTDIPENETPHQTSSADKLNDQ